MIANNNDELQTYNAQLFMLRLWLEDLGNGQTVWRGKVHHMNSGEARYFRDFKTMDTFIKELLEKSQHERNEKR
jgi:hypothetical protein